MKKEGELVKRVFIFVLIVTNLLAMNGCVSISDESSLIEIRYSTYKGQSYPYFDNRDDKESINIVNAEIEANVHRLVDVLGGDDTIYTYTSSAGNVQSILIKTELSISYGTDGSIWGICYDSANQTIIPCAAYLNRIGYSYSEICKDIKNLLNEQSSYEYIDIAYYYFDASTNPIFVVIALEHPAGADAWKRIFYYDIAHQRFLRSPF